MFDHFSYRKGSASCNINVTNLYVPSLYFLTFVIYFESDVKFVLHFTFSSILFIILCLYCLYDLQLEITIVVS